jgi:hypothetical protein
MGKYDRDRFQKELAIRYCLARDIVPFLEVIVASSSDLSDAIEVLTDLDVVGVEAVGDGGLRRTIFDCKATTKMSPINRAFWAAGVKQYTGCDEAYVLLNGKAVHNHRISALSIGVDLHDEQSFRDLGRTIDAAFPADDSYQSAITRWNAVYDRYANNRWSLELFDLSRTSVPLSKTPWSTFRRILAELHAVRGQIDPAKGAHLTIFFDVLASAFVLWAVMGRDVRRFYEPTMNKTEFESVLRYYLWGGKESFVFRQRMRQQVGAKNDATIELPAWDVLVSFVGLIVSAPQCILECAQVCREFSIRAAVGINPDFDKQLSERLRANSRLRQFCAGLSDYLVAAGPLPKDLAKRVQGDLFDI